MIENGTTAADLSTKYSRVKRNVYLTNFPNASSSKVQLNDEVSDEDLPSIDMIGEGIRRVADQFPLDMGILEEDNEEEFEIPQSPLAEKDTLTLEEYDQLIAIQEQDSIALVQHELAYQTEKDLEAQASLEMIQQDFPTLNDEEIEENIDLIDEYYQKNLDYMALEEVATHEVEIETIAKQARLLRSQKISSVEAQSSSIGDLEWCVFWKVYRKYGLSSAYVVHKAGENARKRAKEYFGDFHEKLTRRDAFRHVYWNALMCKNYVTSSKSKYKRMDFAEFAAKALYDCGDLYDLPTDGSAIDEAIDVDARAMDRHNDRLGRNIYRNHTLVKYFFSKKYLSEPSYSKLRRLIKESIAQKSEYIVKFHPDEEIDVNGDNFGGKNNYTAQEVEKLIEDEIGYYSSVYFRKTIASSYRKRVSWFKKKTVYPKFHSKDPNLTYTRLREQTTDGDNDR